MRPLKEKWGLAISGGSVKIPKLYAFLVKSWEVAYYSVLVGTSSGAILALLAVTGNIKAGMDMILTFTVKDIFTENPFTLFGRFMSVWRVVFQNKMNLYDQGKLGETIRKVVSEESFNNWKNDPLGADCYVNVVDPETMEEHFINIKELNYNQAILSVLGSSAIPFFTGSVWLKFLNIFSYDGGWRSHIGSGWLAEKFGDKLNGIISLLSRPKDLNEYPRWNMPNYKLGFKDYAFVGTTIINVLSLVIWLITLIIHTFKGIPMENYMHWVVLGTGVFNGWFLLKRGFNISSIVSRIMEGSNYEISVNDIEKADRECQNSDIPHVVVYSDEYIGGGNLYKTDRKEQNRQYYTGLKHADAELKNQMETL